jgi:hypothetical protein
MSIDKKYLGTRLDACETDIEYLKSNLLGIDTPTQSGTLTYNTASQSPTWNGYDSSKMTLSGTTSGTNAGDYTAKFTPKSPYVWADNLGSEERSVTWTINKAPLTLPSQSGTLTYSGNSQSPSWNSNYDSNKMTLGGTTSGTNAGTYTATFTPKANYMWSSDSSTTAKNVDWSIGRATGTMSLSSTSVATFQGESQQITVTTNSDGTLSASSNYTSRVTTSVSGSTVTLTGGSTGGSATVTVTKAQSTNYTAVSKTISVTNTAVQVMTVEIDQSVGDPSQRCTYKDDAVGMTAGSSAWDTFFGHYPCILTSGVEGK